MACECATAVSVSHSRLAFFIARMGEVGLVFIHREPEPNDPSWRDLSGADGVTTGGGGRADTGVLIWDQQRHVRQPLASVLDCLQVYSRLDGSRQRGEHHASGMTAV